MLALLPRIWKRFSANNCGLLAAAIAFYALLSIFPGLGALISALGLFVDPSAVRRQLDAAQGILPDEAIQLIDAQLTSLVQRKNTQLGLGLVVSLVLTLWSARSAASALMTALDMTYYETDRRSLVVQQLVATALTVAGILAAIIAIIAVAVVPVVMSVFPPEIASAQILALLRWPLLMGIAVGGFAAIFRFGPYRTRSHWRAIVCGAVIACVLWIAGSGFFSLYVSSFGSYDKTYGSLGAVIVLLMWFYVSAMALLIGAATDAELEHLWHPQETVMTPQVGTQSSQETSSSEKTIRS